MHIVPIPAWIDTTWPLWSVGAHIETLCHIDPTAAKVLRNTEQPLQ